MELCKSQKDSSSTPHYLMSLEEEIKNVLETLTADFNASVGPVADHELRKVLCDQFDNHNANKETVTQLFAMHCMACVVSVWNHRSVEVSGYNG